VYRADGESIHLRKETLTTGLFILSPVYLHFNPLKIALSKCTAANSSCKVGGAAELGHEEVNNSFLS
jgi:hypothetical protein